MYRTLIAEAIGTSDPARTALVEEIMRTNRTALDHLSAAQLTKAARLAYADMLLMAAAGMLPFYCQTLGLAVPGGN
jgi:hypothetical protein